MEVKVKSNVKEAMRKLRNVPKKYVPKALVTSLNKVGAEVFTQAKKELAGATGLKQNVVAKKIKKDKAKKGEKTYSIHIKSRYLNAIEFGTKKTKKGVSANIWGKRKIYGGAEEILASSWSSRNLNATQKELRRFMVLRYQESLNDKAWQKYLIRK